MFTCLNRIILILFLFFLTSCKPLDIRSIFNSKNQEIITKNAYGLKEIFEQLFIMDIKSDNQKKLFLSWLHVYSEGSALEGVLRGVMAEEEFRLLELQGALPKNETYLFFLKELMFFNEYLFEKKRFTHLDALPQWPVLSDPSEFNELHNQIKKSDKRDIYLIDKSLDLFLANKEFINEIQTLKLHARVFSEARLLTLKRILLERLLELFQKQEDPSRIAKQYAESSLRLNELRVDFQIEERNKKSFEFHYQWALKNIENKNSDLVFLEWINRIFRAINNFEKK